MQNIKTPNARNTDPHTSHLSGQQITDSLVRRNQMNFVVGMVEVSPSQTSAELARMNNVDRYMVARRLSDAKGIFVEQAEARKCGVSGKKAVTWILSK